jgi:hypothetical protein
MSARIHNRFYWFPLPKFLQEVCYYNAFFKLGYEYFIFTLNKKKLFSDILEKTKGLVNRSFVRNFLSAKVHSPVYIVFIHGHRFNEISFTL